MIIFFIGLLGGLLTTNQPVAAGNSSNRTAGVSNVVVTPNPNDPVEKEFQKLMEDDDAALAEVDGWIRENQAFASQGAGVPNADLNRRIRARLDTVRKAYEDFLKRHPDHARAHTAFGSFLGNSLFDEEGQEAEYDKARQLDPQDPAPWNNLANLYGHRGPVKKAFEYYAKAIELDPNESVYYFNFAVTVYLFRKDAREYYQITEQQVFDKALELYRKAIKLDPTNFELATEFAESYYGIQPTRTEDALRAWTNALAIAQDEIQREGVYIHLARIKLHAERFDEARQHLSAVTNGMYNDLKERLLRNLNAQESKAKGTNSPAGTNSPVETIISMKTNSPPATNSPPREKE